MDIGNNMIFEQTAVRFNDKAFASVKITEYPDSGQANPEPISDNSDDGFEDFLSPQALKNITGKSNLSEVTLLEMEVDTSETSIGNLGHLLPNLKQLKLSNSIITSFRDLGTSLNDLTTLWLCRCNLIDLDGISCFNSLKELYLAYNEIDDLSSLSMLDGLGVLDLEGNNVDDIAQVEFLALCSKLASLTLSGNPIELTPHPETSEKDLKFYDYRSAISKAVPQLRILDDDPFLFDIINGKHTIRSTATNKKNDSKHFKEDLLFVQDCLKALPVIDEDEQDEQGEFRPSSSSRMRPGSGIRNERTRPASGRNRPLSSRTRPPSALARSSLHSRSQERPETAQRRPESVKSGRSSIVDGQNSLAEDEMSDLTHGSRQVICGNPVRALLQRRKELKGSIRLKLDRESPEPNIDKFVAEHSYHDDDGKEEPLDRNDIFDELKRWREDFEKNSSDLMPSQNTGKIESFYEETGRNSLSPTPPSSGNPTRNRPNRRQPMKNHQSFEPPRPQTVNDFRTSSSPYGYVGRSKRTNVASKSVDLDEIHKMGLGSSSDDSSQASDDLDKRTNHNQMTSAGDIPTNSKSSVRPRQYRPGTAAAALKRMNRKPFT